MMGHAKDHGKRSAAFGWLNPFFTRTGDGDTDKEFYIVLSQTTLNQLTKEIEWVDV
jgi:hypothetical protein